jgi:hypothetical protein
VTSLAVDAEMSLGDDLVVVIAITVIHDWQVLGEVETIRLREGRVGKFAPAGGGHDLAFQIVGGVAVRRQAGWPDEF